MKKSIITLLAGLTLTTTDINSVTAMHPQTAHAGLIWKLAAITYLYKNRATVKAMFDKAKAKAHSTGVPKLVAGASANGHTTVYTVTKNHRYSLGSYPSKLVSIIQSDDAKVKAELSKIAH